MNIQCKRVYDPAEQSDGYRILVDRLCTARYQKNRFSPLMSGIKKSRRQRNCAKPFTAKSSIMQPFASNILQNWRNTSKKGKRLADIAKNSR